MSLLDVEVPLSTGPTLLRSIAGGRTLLVMNIASQCSFTTANLTALAEIVQQQQRASARNRVVVLLCPSAQFGQEPKKSACEVQSWVQQAYPALGSATNKETNVFFTEPLKVKGPQAHPLFLRLQEHFGAPVRWNYTKFVVDRHGVPRCKLEPGDVTSLESWLS